MIDIKLKNIQKKYGNNVVIPNINCDISAGERIVLLGPSGCGKSTLLRMIAGLEDVSSGEIIMGDRNITKTPPGERDVSMVFQNYALYPHMTVEDNITYALKVNKVPQKEITTQLEAVLTALELEPYKYRKPHELSGGQRQRVALARATVKRSKVFLLDEPLSNLDVQLRVSARRAMLDIHEAFWQTMLYVTHDQIEAMTFGTKIILLNKGEIQMYDTPYNVYHYPANIFTAKFIGSPSMNLFSNVLICGERASKNSQKINLDKRWQGYFNESNYYFMGIRPENVVLHKSNKDGLYFEGTVSHIENQGPNYAVYIKVEDEIVVGITPDSSFSQGDKFYMELLQEHLHFFDKETEKNIGRPF